MADFCFFMFIQKVQGNEYRKKNMSEIFIANMGKYKIVLEKQEEILLQF